jgi:hypothetical protein
MTTSNPSSSGQPPSTPAQDEKTNGDTASVDNSGANKEDIKDKEHSNKSNHDNEGAEGGSLDDILDPAGKEVTRDMGFK